MLTLVPNVGAAQTFRSVSLNTEESRKFTALLVLMKHIIKNLTDNTFTTKRDLYYKDVELFDNSQKKADSLLGLLASSMGVELSQLAIYPSQKGLMYMGGMEEPNLIPTMCAEFAAKICKSVKIVVIIEKDAVFKTVCEHVSRVSDQFHNVLFVTGKGFPDTITKEFISSLAQYHIPIHGFVDSDVYGILIFKSYRDYLPSEETRYLFHLSGCFILEFSQDYLNISHRDATLIISTLKKLMSHRGDPEIEKWVQEIQRGLYFYKKAEMNVMKSAANPELDSVSYILKKVGNLIILQSSNRT